MQLLLIVIFPLAWPFIAKLLWHKEVTWRELAMNVLCATILAAFVYWMGMVGKTWDTEILNGELTSKERVTASCSHSYECRCRRPVKCHGSGKDRKCGREKECDTCYEHDQDYNWRLSTTLGSLYVNRVDRQGVQQPPRWIVAKVGDPVAQTHQYENLIKAAQHSLFNFAEDSAMERFASKIPPYPIEIVDLHYANRVIEVGLFIPNRNEWNNKLAAMLKKLGPQKQANVVIVVVKTDEPDYYYALRRAWLGGKKNDIVVIIGTTDYPQISWVKVMSWTDKTLFLTKLEGEISDMKQIDQDKILAAIESNTLKHFERKRMREFKYLEAEIEPDTWVVATAAVLGALISIILSLFFAEQWPFNRKKKYR
jgi:hypothetical protein